MCVSICNKCIWRVPECACEHLQHIRGSRPDTVNKLQKLSSVPVTKGSEKRKKRWFTVVIQVPRSLPRVLSFFFFSCAISCALMCTITDRNTRSKCLLLDNLRETSCTSEAQTPKKRTKIHYGMIPGTVLARRNRYYFFCFFWDLGPIYLVHT